MFPEPRALVGRTGRMGGLDGGGKMSKSRDNGIELAASADEVRDRLRRAVTDPARVRASDPGHPDVCPVFSCHEALNADEAPGVRADCERGALGCAACKDALARRINGMLAPMRERRAHFAARPADVDGILESGAARARRIARATMEEVRAAMQIGPARI